MAFLPFGEMLRFPWMFHAALRVLDVFVGILFFLTVVFKHTDYKDALKKNKSVLLFTGILIVSNLWSFHNSTVSSALYLFRTILYLQIPLILDSLMKTINRKKTLTILQIGSAILICSAVFQYYLYPAIQNLFYLGYDSHYYRAVGLFLDPNLLGLVLVFIVLLLIHIPKSPVRILMLGAALITLALTFSRISILSLIVGVGIIFIGKRISYKMLFLCATIVGSVLVFIPKQLGEGNKLFRTNSIVAKTEAWQLGVGLWRQNPLIGIGFNNSQLYKPTIRPTAASIKIPDNSFYGLDSTVLTLFVTSGILGILGYFSVIAGLLRINSPLHTALTIAYFIHSFSTNSFLTPTVFLYFMLVYKLTERK
ncbi:MAG: O-antigen ligase family protein [Patescibacteria group bacterium]